MKKNKRSSAEAFDTQREQGTESITSGTSAHHHHQRLHVTYALLTHNWKQANNLIGTCSSASAGSPHRVITTPTKTRVRFSVKLKKEEEWDQRSWSRIFRIVGNRKVDRDCDGIRHSIDGESQRDCDAILTQTQSQRALTGKINNWKDGCVCEEGDDHAVSCSPPNAGNWNAGSDRVIPVISFLSFDHSHPS
jgi:hypothetical protein